MPEQSTPPHRLQRAALIAEIIGAGAVVASVIYLALQINSNNKLLEAQAYFNFLAIGHQATEMVITDPALAELKLRCDATPYEVTPAEWERCGLFYFTEMNSFEYVYYQQGLDALPRGFADGAFGYYKGMLTAPGYRRFWKEYQDGYGEPFRSYLEASFPPLPTTSSDEDQ